MAEKDAAVLAFIAHFSDGHGYAPTYREIGAGVGLRSTQSVFQAVHRLRKAGLVEWDPGLTRTLRLTGDAR